MDDAKIENRRSRVRIYITYFAAIFLFIGGAGLIIYLLLEGTDNSDAIMVFNTILPVATGVISYWFASRSQQNKSDLENSGENK